MLEIKIIEEKNKYDGLYWNHNIICHYVCLSGTFHYFEDYGGINQGWILENG